MTLESLTYSSDQSVGSSIMSNDYVYALNKHYLYPECEDVLNEIGDRREMILLQWQPTGLQNLQCIVLQSH